MGTSVFRLPVGKGSRPVSINQVQTPGMHVHVNLFGPLPISRGNSHLLTIIDSFTCWPEAIPLRETNMAAVAQVFVMNWIVRFGVPADITSDCGPQFYIIAVERCLQAPWDTHTSNDCLSPASKWTH